MAFRSLSWMNTSSGSRIDDTERVDSAPLDKLSQIRQYLLALPSCQKNTLSSNDHKKAISFITDELLKHTPAVSQRAMVVALAIRLPGSFSRVILDILSTLS